MLSLFDTIKPIIYAFVIALSSIFMLDMFDFFKGESVVFGILSGYIIGMVSAIISIIWHLRKRRI